MKRRSRISIFDRFDELSANSVIESYDNAKAFLAELEIEADDLKVTGVNEFKKAFCPGMLDKPGLPYKILTGNSLI